MTDDLILFHKDKKSHNKGIKLILATLEKHGLKISPTKYCFFRNDLSYLGHRILIKDSKPCITAQKDHALAIRALSAPKDKRALLRFIGMVSYLNQYLPRLQPMHKLTRSFKYSKGQKNTKQSNKLHWTLQCQEKF